MAIVLPGALFREEFKERNIAPQMLSRQIEDTATIAPEPEQLGHSGVSGYSTTPPIDA